MKILGLIFTLILVLGGCRSGHPESKKEKNCEDISFLLSGKLVNGENRPLYFQVMSGSGIISLDTIRLESEGYFNVWLPVHEPSFFRIKNETGDFIIIFPSASDTIFIFGNYDELYDYRIKGNIETEQIAELHLKTQVFMEEINHIASLTRDSMESENFPELKHQLKMKYDSLFSDFRNYSLGFIHENKKSPVSLIALHNIIGHGVRVFDIQKDFKIYALVDSFLNERHPDLPQVKELHDRLNVIRLQTASRPVAGGLTYGDPAPGISLPDTSGIIQSLSSLRGQIVLIEFWGSWSPPNRMRNSELKELYNKWKGSGFEIFQIGIEQDRMQWIDAIREDNLPWIHVSDLKFWESPVCNDYRLNSIPASFLIDSESNIIGLNMNINEIDEILNNLIN